MQYQQQQQILSHSHATNQQHSQNFIRSYIMKSSMSEIKELDNTNYHQRTQAIENSSIFDGYEHSYRKCSNSYNHMLGSGAHCQNDGVINKIRPISLNTGSVDTNDHDFIKSIHSHDTSYLIGTAGIFFSFLFKQSNCIMKL